MRPPSHQMPTVDFELTSLTLHLHDWTYPITKSCPFNLLLSLELSNFLFFYNCTLFRQNAYHILYDHSSSGHLFLMTPSSLILFHEGRATFISLTLVSLLSRTFQMFSVFEISSSSSFLVNS